MKFALTILWFLLFSAAAESSTLRWANGADPKDVDPQIISGSFELRIAQNLFEPLVGKHPKTLKPIPGVALSWTKDISGKKYTFKLRRNSLWSNGEKVTAHDFVRSWIRLLRPETAAEYAYQGYYFKNGKAFNKGELKDSAQLGFRAKNDWELEVELESPTPFFLDLLSNPALFPVPVAVIEKHGAKWTTPPNFVSNGPFVVAKWELAKKLELTRNPKYWDVKNVALQTVEVLPIESVETQEKMFRTGQVDLINELPPEKVAVWKKEAPTQVYSHPYLATYFYRFNVTKPPLNNPKVRRALSLAIDRTRLVKLVLKGEQLPATTFTPPGTGGTTLPAGLAADGSGLESARKLLAEAGYAAGKGFPSIELIYPTNETHRKVAEALQAMWKQALGIEVTILNQEWKVLNDNEKTLNYQICRGGWFGDYNDPNTFLDVWVGGGGNNKTGWSNPAYDALIEKAAREANAKQRTKLFAQAEQILAEEAPFMPLYFYHRNYLLSPKVQNWHPNLQDYHPLKYLTLTP